MITFVKNVLKVNTKKKVGNDVYFGNGFTPDELIKKKKKIINSFDLSVLFHCY